MSSVSEVRELLDFLKQPREDVRVLASQHVLGLTGGADGTTLLMKAEAAESLCRVVGDASSEVSKNAVSALINLCDSPKMTGQMLKAKVVGLLMEGLKSADCPHKRLNVMLLCNLSQTHAACVQLMSLHEDTVLVGLHLRRLIQWFVQPPPADGEDTFEYCGEVLRNVCQLKEARAIVMDKERGILQALLPQLKASSVIRRRGVAGALRHCGFEAELLPSLLAPSLKLIQYVVEPLAGPELYKPEDTVGMPLPWFEQGRLKTREPDAEVRRLLVDVLVFLSSVRQGREAMRTLKVYPVVKALHEWIDANCRVPLSADGGDVGAGAGAGTSSALVPAGSAVDDDDEPPLTPEDDATVDSIINVVDLLLREEGDDEEDGGDTATARPDADTDATPAAATGDPPAITDA